MYMNGTNARFIKVIMIEKPLFGREWFITGMKNDNADVKGH